MCCRCCVIRCLLDLLAAHACGSSCLEQLTSLIGVAKERSGVRVSQNIHSFILLILQRNGLQPKVRFIGLWSRKTTVYLRNASKMSGQYSQQQLSDMSNSSNNRGLIQGASDQPTDEYTALSVLSPIDATRPCRAFAARHC